MRFLDYLFHGKELKAIGNYFKMLNGYSPIFTSFSGGVYEMDLTRTAVNNFATHCSKLKPEIEGSALKTLEKTLQHKPNYFMDTTKFIKRLATYVAVEHTAFIIPIEDEYGRLCGWYPLRAERCEVIECEGQLYLRYLFANGSYGAIEFERVGIMTDFEYKDDLFGEDNSTLAPTMQLIHTQNEGIINAVKNSANIRFLAKVANMLKPEDIKKERKRFTEDNLSADNDSGMIIYDNKFSDLKQVESKPYTPNALQMQHIQENVCTHFGTNMDILQNKFDENTWNAYYEGKIEPFAIQLSLVMTNMSFTERERACGNAIFFSANRLQYASNATKLSVSTQLFDRALLNRNGVKDDLGVVQKTILTSEDVTLKAGLLTWCAKTLEKLCATARVTETAKKRTVKIGGIKNQNHKKYLIRFLHEDSEDGNIRVTIVGRNEAGFSFTFAKDAESTIEPQFKAHPMDKDGTLLIFDEDIVTEA